jgi:peptidoglycan/xylan/chitin deacetylase (PgdA/CDA1 family)
MLHLFHLKSRDVNCRFNVVSGSSLTTHHSLLIAAPIFTAMFYMPNTPLWMRLIFPSGVEWSGSPENNAVYLTFDDGPTPNVTEFVLEELDKYGVKGTFFCIGDNVAAHPLLFEKIKAFGHAVGNHTMNHPNGWTTRDDVYIQQVADANMLIRSDLFRPPYGKIKRSQQAGLLKLNPRNRTIMWSVITGDFDEGIDGNTCFEHVKRHTRAGSIIVFHDSDKAFPRLKAALPATLKWLQENGFNPGLLD